jgi:hypothetical protein
LWCAYFRDLDLMRHRTWKGALLALQFGALLARTGGASCSNDVGKARAERMAMHCQRVNTSQQGSCAAIDCGTLSSLVQAFCAIPKGRPALCSEYPAVVLSKPVGIPADLERIMNTVAEDLQVAAPGAARMRDTFTLITSVAANVKSSKATVDAEQKSFDQRSTAAAAAYKRHKAAVDSKSAAQLAEAPKLLEAARTEYEAAVTVGESLVKHTAELRDYGRTLTASVEGGDRVASEINLYARDAKNAELVMEDALRSGAQAQADSDSMARVKAFRDQAKDAANETAKAATEVTQLSRKAHTLAEMGPGYDAKELESQASKNDEALKKKLDELKHSLAGLSGTAGNLCDRAMLERSWKASPRTSTSRVDGLVTVSMHTLDAKQLGTACPFLKSTLGSSEPASGSGAGEGARSFDMGFVPFKDLGLEILVLVDSGAKCSADGCGHTFFVNEGSGFAKASSPIVTRELVGFARKGVDVFAIMTAAEWKLRRAPGKPSELVYLRAR